MPSPLSGGAQWMHWDPASLSAAGPVFHLPVALKSEYGDFDSYDLSSERGLLEYVIDYVNRSQLKAITEQLRAGPATRAVGLRHLQQLLHTAVHGPSAPGDPDLSNPSDEFLLNIRRNAASIKWIPRLERTATGASWRHHAFIPGFDAFSALIATFLMKGELREELGHCRYPLCGDFFLSGERTLYCDEECMLDANTQQSATRKNKQRARNALVKQGYASDRVHGAVEQSLQAHPDAKAKQLAVYAESILNAGSRRPR